MAEEAGIVIAFHPDDPPVPSLFGVPRIMANLSDCRKALKIANSPNVGICLCCGTWAEGGTAMGIDPAGAIRYFGARKQNLRGSLSECELSFTALPGDACG